MLKESKSEENFEHNIKKFSTIKHVMNEIFEQANREENFSHTFFLLDRKFQ
jgi:hypothetical protein